MANHPSAEKRNRQRIKRTLRNRSVSSAVRTQVKHVRTALAAHDKDGAVAALKVAERALGKAATKGVIHEKAASRTVSRLASQVHAMKAAPAAEPKATGKPTKAKASTLPKGAGTAKAASKATKPAS
jgi:small subunit ribosomal protein S20